MPASPVQPWYLVGSVRPADHTLAQEGIPATDPSVATVAAGSAARLELDPQPVSSTSAAEAAAMPVRGA
jgi:hypothetical protein